MNFMQAAPAKCMPTGQPGCHGLATRQFFASLALLGWLSAVRTTHGEGTNASNYADLSIEQLMNETVTSVSKKEQRLGDAAAAISVLSNDDLKRSGATSIPEALRWVPGMNVAAASSSQWAVSARGFNGIYANKLLVLVDGRTVYTPIFAGVYWDLQQPMLADLDRVEVIRGPGGTIWGANAVNGVINIVSRSARDTQGALVYGGGGDVHLITSGARYGGRLDENTFYRVFGSYQQNQQYEDGSGHTPLADSPNDDRWSGWHGGFRLDHYADEQTHVTWQADATQSDLDNHLSDACNFNTVARWSRQLSEHSSLEVQFYGDRTTRNDWARAKSTTDTLDLTLQHTSALGERNELNWGAGYRYINTKVEPTGEAWWVQLLDRSFDRSLASAFVQDEFKLVPDRLSLTLGTKVEHNEMTGWEFQPSLRATFKPAERQTLWAAVSRTVRTPSEAEGSNLAMTTLGDPFVNPGDGLLYLPVLVGNPEANAENQWTCELGYRNQPADWINFEINGFYNRYEDLLTVGAVSEYQPGIPLGMAVVPFGNLQDGDGYGGEASVTISPAASWRLTASYSLLLGSMSSVPDQFASYSDAIKGSPRNQVLLRSSYDFSSRLSADLQARYVDPIASAGGRAGVPSYFTADVHLNYRLTDRLEISLVGQNLLDQAHLEQGIEPLIITAEVPRGFYGKLTWKF